MTAELSDIEKQRLINIQRNKNLLMSMQIGRQNMEQSMKELRSGRNAASQPTSMPNKDNESNCNSDDGNANATSNGAGVKRSSPAPGEIAELRRSKRARVAVYNELVLARKVYSDAAEEKQSVKKLETNPITKGSKDDSDSEEDTDTSTQRRRKWTSKNNIKSKEVGSDEGDADVSNEKDRNVSKKRQIKNKKHEGEDGFDDKGKDSKDGKIEIDDSDGDSDKNQDESNDSERSVLDKSSAKKQHGSKPHRVTNKFLALMKKAAARDSDDESRESDDNAVNLEVSNSSKTNSKSLSQSKAHSQPQTSKKNDLHSQNSASKSLSKSQSKQESHPASKSTSKSAFKSASKPETKPASPSHKSSSTTKEKPVTGVSDSGNSISGANANKLLKSRRKSKSLPNSSALEASVEKLRQKSHSVSRHKRRSFSKIDLPVSPLIHANGDGDEGAAVSFDGKPNKTDADHEAINSDSDEFDNAQSKSVFPRSQQKSSYTKANMVGFPGQAVAPATIKIERSPEVDALQQVQTDLETSAAQAADPAYSADRMLCAGVLNRHVAGLRKLVPIQITQGHESFSSNSSKSSKYCPTVMALHPSLAAKLVCVGNARGTITFVGPGAGGTATIGSKLRLHGKLPVSNILIHPDNPARVVTAGWDGTIASFDLAAPKASSGSVVGVDSHSLHDKLITKVAFGGSAGEDVGSHSLHYTTLSGIYGHVDLRAPVNTNKPMKLQSHDARSPLLDLAVRPDHASHVATATADGIVKLWDTRYFRQDTYFASFSANSDGAEDSTGGATLLTALDWSPAGLLAGVVDSEAGEQGALVFDRTLQHAISNPDAAGGVRRLRYDAAYLSPIVNTAFAPPTYLLGGGALARDDGAARIVAAYGSALLSPVAGFQTRPLDGLCKFAVLGNSTSFANGVGVCTGAGKQNNIVLLDSRANVLQTLELDIREPADEIALVKIHPLLNWTACITRSNKLHIWS